MNDRFFRCAAVPDFTLTQHFSRCERAQQESDTSGVGSIWSSECFCRMTALPRRAAFAMVDSILCCIVIQGDRRIVHVASVLARPRASQPHQAHILKATWGCSFSYLIKGQFYLSNDG